METIIFPCLKHCFNKDYSNYLPQVLVWDRSCFVMNKFHLARSLPMIAKCRILLDIKYEHFIQAQTSLQEQRRSFVLIKEHL